MFTMSVRFATVQSLFICALILVGLSSVVHAQETAPEADSSAGSVETAKIVSGGPYAVEALLGDEVYGDFVVGPGKIELQIEPGESKIVEITISNRTGVKKTFDVLTEDFTGSSDPSQTVMLLGSDRGPYSMKDYVSVSAPRFTLGHNERARIPVTISIPADAEPGGRYGSVLVSTVSTEAKVADEQGTQPQSAVISRIGSLFFVTIPGKVEKAGALRDFTTVPEQSFYQNGPINFGVLFENTGAIHLIPRGELRIKNIFDEEVGYLQIEPWFVMPKSLRLREITWDRDFLFGRYTATVQINKGYDDALDTMNYSFWVLPWKPIAGLFFTVFMVLFLTRAFFRRFEFKRKN